MGKLDLIIRWNPRCYKFEKERAARSGWKIWKKRVKPRSNEAFFGQTCSKCFLPVIFGSFVGEVDAVLAVQLCFLSSCRANRTKSRFYSHGFTMFHHCSNGSCCTCDIIWRYHFPPSRQNNQTLGLSWPRFLSFLELAVRLAENSVDSTGSVLRSASYYFLVMFSSLFLSMFFPDVEKGHDSRGCTVDTHCARLWFIGGYWYGESGNISGHFKHT